MKRSPLERRTPLKRGGQLARRSTTRRQAISPASKAQRDKAKTVSCIVTSVRGDETVVDPAHLCARGRGGCSDSLCVVPLRRDQHRLFDDGKLDLLPYLLARGMIHEICHALEHYDGDLIGLLQRLTGRRWRPEDE